MPDAALEALRAGGAAVAVAVRQARERDAIEDSCGAIWAR